MIFGVAIIIIIIISFECIYTSNKRMNFNATYYVNNNNNNKYPMDYPLMPIKWKKKFIENHKQKNGRTCISHHVQCLNVQTHTDTIVISPFFRSFYWFRHTKNGWFMFRKQRFSVCLILGSLCYVLEFVQVLNVCVLHLLRYFMCLFLVNFSGGLTTHITCFSQFYFC